jgi:hypothetical protein
MIKKFIDSGINKIENIDLDNTKKNKRINNLTKAIDFNMKVGEVDDVVKSNIKGIK